MRDGGAGRIRTFGGFTHTCFRNRHHKPLGHGSKLLFAGSFVGILAGLKVAEKEGFEPSVGCPTPVFKTSTLSLSDTSPVAEPEGFEPSVSFHPHPLSRRAP